MDLINEVRTRAGVASLSLAGFAFAQELRDHILQERLWEFWFESKEREVLIRHNKFVSNAQARGVAAQNFHRLFPLLQNEIDANPNIEQNPDY